MHLARAEVHVVAQLRQSTRVPQKAPAPTIGPVRGPNAGNQAAMDDLGLGGGPRFGAAHASPDHAELGGDEEVEAGRPPARLRTGDVNAMVDYVGSLDELGEMSGPELEEAAALLRKPELTAEEEERLLELFPNYASVSLDNDEHFAPSDPELCAPSGGSGGDHVAEIESGVSEAVGLAAAAGRAGDAEGMNAALLRAAWAGHFIADAYSAGHLFNKGDLVARVLAELTPETVARLLAQVPDITARICVEGAAELARWRYRLGPGMSEPVGPQHIGVLVATVLATRHDVVGNGIALAVHETLGHTGVTVTGGGATWTMFGDGALDPVSQVHCTLAIEGVYDALEQAFAAPELADPAGVAAGLVGRLPKPVGSAKDQIRQVIDAATTAEGGGMADAIVAGSVHLLGDILQQAGAALPGEFVRVGADLPVDEAPAAAPTSWMPQWKPALSQPEG